MHRPCTRALAVCLALLLTGGATPVAASEGAARPLRRGKPVRTPASRTEGRLSIPYLIVGPGTPEEYVVWFPQGEGPLTMGEPVTREEVRGCITHLAHLAAAQAPTPALASIAEKLGSAQRLQPWEEQLWRDYLAYLGTQQPVTQAARTDMQPTAADRRDMALRVALTTLLPGMAEEMGRTFTPENVLFTVSSAVTGYLLTLAIPEPVTKLALVAVTLTLLTAFGAQLLVHVVSE